MLESCLSFELGRVNFELSTLITKPILSKTKVAAGSTSYSVPLFC